MEAKKNFNRFEEIKNVSLRVYNRVVLLNNINEDFGRDAAEDYVSIFFDGERKQMFIMQEYIKKYGTEVVRRSIIVNSDVDENLVDRAVATEDLRSEHIH